jgi:hypothetical protein
LKNYFDLNSNQEDQIKDCSVSKCQQDSINGRVTHIQGQLDCRSTVPWSRSLRISILDHLEVFDINASLLINVVEIYSFDFEIEDLVEIVRALDILGAEIRLSVKLSYT